MGFCLNEGVIQILLLFLAQLLIALRLFLLWCPWILLIPLMVSFLIFISIIFVLMAMLLFSFLFFLLLLPFSLPLLLPFYFFLNTILNPLPTIPLLKLPNNPRHTPLSQKSHTIPHSLLIVSQNFVTIF